MLLDLTRNPLIVLPDACEKHVVVRTLHRPGISANVIRRQAHAGDRVYPVALEPGAKLTRNGQTLFETRIDVGPSLVMFDPELRQVGPSILPDPHEAASAYTDLLTGKTGTWRIQIQVQRNPRNNTWLVMAGPVGEPFRVAVSMRDLYVGIGRLADDCEFPLARYTQTVAQEGTGPRESVWDRLAQNDDPD